jgi:hypothetical protein
VYALKGENPTFECKVVDCVGEIMLAAVVTEVRNQLVQITGIRLERTTRRKMNVADDLIHADTARDSATFFGLFSKLLPPSFIFALTIIISICSEKV